MQALPAAQFETTSLYFIHEQARVRCRLMYIGIMLERWLGSEELARLVVRFLEDGLVLIWLCDPIPPGSSRIPRGRLPDGQFSWRSFEYVAACLRR